MADRIGYNGADKWKLKATELLNEGGGGGTDDYEDLENKPSINGVELSGNKTAAQLGMYTKSEVDTSLANKMDLNATNGSISDLSILGNYGIGDVENGGRLYITGWQNKYRGFNFPEIAIGSYDDENDTFSADISMNMYGFVISNLEFNYFGNHGQGSLKTLDVHIDDSQFLIKEGIGDTNIIEVADTGNINVNASHVVFNSDDWVSAYAVDGFSFACDDDFEIDAVGIKIASDGITNGRALYVDANGYLVSSAVTDTELGYLSGVTSSIQTQLDAKAATTDLASYLPLAGGTMTDWINFKNNMDLSTAPSSSVYGFAIRLQDKNADTIGYIRPIQNTSNRYIIQFLAQRNIGGTDYTNSISLGLSSTGEGYVALSHPLTWQVAMSVDATDGASIPISSFCTVASGFTLDSANSAVYKVGNHIFANLKFTGSATSSNAGTIAPITIKSSYRPKVGCSFGTWVNTNTSSGRRFAPAIGSIGTNGSTEVVTPSASTAYGNSSYSWNGGTFAFDYWI